VINSCGKSAKKSFGWVATNRSAVSKGSICPVVLNFEFGLLGFVCDLIFDACDFNDVSW